MKYLKIIIFSLATILLFISCANQKPPGGGEEDKEAPKITFHFPKSGVTNFKGNSIILGFNEYVDKRSFIDALFFSPSINEDYEISWSGKIAEITFSNSLDKLLPNKTILVNLRSELMDLYGNSLYEPFSFAFSTGAKIDNGIITGKVFNAGDKIISVMATQIDSPDVIFNPTITISDYQTQTSKEGLYAFNNLSAGKYRIYSISDDDRNLLYTQDREVYGVLWHDLIVNDSDAIDNVNLFLNNPAQVYEPDPIDINYYFSDSLNIIACSIQNNHADILPEQSIYFYIKKYFTGRDDFVSSFTLMDDSDKPVKIVFNWRNDSLVEVFPAKKFTLNKEYKIKLEVKIKPDSVYYYNLKFKTISENSFGNIEGKFILLNILQFEKYPIGIKLFDKEKTPSISYSGFYTDSTFRFQKIIESNYTLFSFIDMDNSGNFNYGKLYPFEFSEPFYVYPQEIRVKGGWTTENIIVNFDN